MHAYGKVTELEKVDAKGERGFGRVARGADKDILEIGGWGRFFEYFNYAVKVVCELRGCEIQFDGVKAMGFHFNARVDSFSGRLR
jgi:hypothetical protein